MGFACSFLAWKGRDAEELFEALGLADRGVEDPEPGLRGTLSCAALPDGWFVIWAGGHDFLTPQRLEAASSGGEAVGWRVEDHVMASDACGYRDGREIWSLFYDCDESDEIEVSGEPPPAFASLYAAAQAEQEDLNEADADVDVIYGVVAETCQSVCGFKHDIHEFDWGTPHFTKLERTGQEEPLPIKRGSWLSRLLGS